MTDESCATCRFFLSEEEPGYCRRFPPAVSMFKKPVEFAKPQQFDVVSEFPRMKSSGWCGEWRPIGTVQ